MDQPTDKSTLSSIKPYCLHAKNKLHMLSSREQFNDYLTLKLPQRWLWEAWHQFICDKLVSDSNNAILLYQLISNSDIRSTCTYTHSDPPTQTNEHGLLQHVSLSFFSQYISSFDAANKNPKGVLHLCVFTCIHQACVLLCAYMHSQPPPTPDMMECVRLGTASV